MVFEGLGGSKFDKKTNNKWDVEQPPNKSIKIMKKTRQGCPREPNGAPKASLGHPKIDRN